MPSNAHYDRGIFSSVRSLIQPCALVEFDVSAISACEVSESTGNVTGKRLDDVGPLQVVPAQACTSRFHCSLPLFK